jgi:hypothetical protein
MGGMAIHVNFAEEDSPDFLSLFLSAVQEFDTLANLDLTKNNEVFGKIKEAVIYAQKKSKQKRFFKSPTFILLIFVILLICVVLYLAFYYPWDDHAARWPERKAR